MADSVTLSLLGSGSGTDSMNCIILAARESSNVADELKALKRSRDDLHQALSTGAEAAVTLSKSVEEASRVYKAVRGQLLSRLTDIEQAAQFSDGTMQISLKGEKKAQTLAGELQSTASHAHLLLQQLRTKGVGARAALGAYRTVKDALARAEGAARALQEEAASSELEAQLLLAKLEGERRVEGTRSGELAKSRAALSSILSATSLDRHVTAHDLAAAHADDAALEKERAALSTAKAQGDATAKADAAKLVKLQGDIASVRSALAVSASKAASVLARTAAARARTSKAEDDRAVANEEIDELELSIASAQSAKAKVEDSMRAEAAPYAGKWNAARAVHTAASSAKTAAEAEHSAAAATLATHQASASAEARVTTAQAEYEAEVRALVVLLSQGEGSAVVPDEEEFKATLAAALQEYTTASSASSPAPPLPSLPAWLSAGHGELSHARAQAEAGAGQGGAPLTPIPMPAALSVLDRIRLLRESVSAMMEAVHTPCEGGVQLDGAPGDPASYAAHRAGLASKEADATKRLRDLDAVQRAVDNLSREAEALAQAQARVRAELTRQGGDLTDARKSRVLSDKRQEMNDELGEMETAQEATILRAKAAADAEYSAAEVELATARALRHEAEGKLAAAKAGKAVPKGPSLAQSKALQDSRKILHDLVAAAEAETAALMACAPIARPSLPGPPLPGASDGSTDVLHDDGSGGLSLSILEEETEEEEVKSFMSVTSPLHLMPELGSSPVHAALPPPTPAATAIGAGGRLAQVSSFVTRGQQQSAAQSTSSGAGGDRTLAPLPSPPAASAAGSSVGAPARGKAAEKKRGADAAAPTSSTDAVVASAPVPRPSRGGGSVPPPPPVPAAASSTSSAAVGAGGGPKKKAKKGSSTAGGV